MLSLLSDDEFETVIDTITTVMNNEAPIKVNKPKVGTSYVTIKLQFQDPRFWQSYQNEFADNHPKIVAAIRDNSRKMIQQFMTSDLGQQIVQQDDAKAILEDFLNHYLLLDNIRLVTTNPQKQIFTSGWPLWKVNPPT